MGQISRYDRIIQNKFYEIIQLRELSKSISAVKCEEKVQTSSNHDKIGCSIAKIDLMERKLYKIIDEYMEKKEIIISQIDSMANEEYYNVLFAKYIEKKTFEKIADEMHYSFRHITRIHGRALIEFEKKYGTLYIENDLCPKMS